MVAQLISAYRESTDGVVFRDSDPVLQIVNGYRFEYATRDFFQINPEVLEVRSFRCCGPLNAII
jgi:tRNA/tmRNA/rRNA uracil-C5-methylase (TrmA/RlmC/RlmD family)